MSPRSPPKSSARLEPTASSSSHNAQSTSVGSQDTTTTTTTHQHKKFRFGFSEVANLFIRLRRFESRASLRQAKSTESQQEATKSDTNNGHATTTPVGSPIKKTTTPVATTTVPPSSASPPVTPTKPKVRRFSTPYSRQSPSKSKSHHLSCSSGDEPQTHPGVADGIAKDLQPLAVEYRDTFECVGGVNVTTLLRATRSALLEKVTTLGANALIDEKWESTICGPKHGTYKVKIQYSASAAYSSKPDPRRPIALDQANGIPGLMTIVKRNEL